MLAYGVIVAVGSVIVDIKKYVFVPVFRPCGLNGRVGCKSVFTFNGIYSKMKLYEFKIIRKSVFIRCAFEFYIVSAH